MINDLISTTNNKIEAIKVQDLVPLTGQPREIFNETSLEELASSIKLHGIIQPIIVNPSDNGKYTIIAGERRWRAAKKLGLNTIPCIIKELSIQKSHELALIENIQRENLSPLEEARAYEKLIKDYKYSHEDLALRVAKDRSTITNSLRILTLPEKILEDLNDKNISLGHAKSLCGLDDARKQLKIRQIIIDKKLSVRQTEDLIKAVKKEKTEPKKLLDNLTPDLRYICDQLKGHLGTKVKITGKHSFGKIEISYYSEEDLERIVELVLGTSYNKLPYPADIRDTNDEFDI